MAMSRSTSMQPLPQKGEPDSGGTCEICGAYLRRNTDLPRHMLIHSKNKHNLMFTCPVDGCGHQTLQKSNLATHIRTHTRAKPHKCPELYPNGMKCDFSTADPSSLHRHRKRKHGYTPRPKPHPYLRARGPRVSPVIADVEGDAASECESEESFGLRPSGSRAREEGPVAAAEGGGGADAEADAEADVDVDVDVDDADADGEPDPDVEVGVFENVSAERTMPPPEPQLEHPPARERSPVVEQSPLHGRRPALDLEPAIPPALDPILSNISNTRTDFGSSTPRVVVDP